MLLYTGIDVELRYNLKNNVVIWKKILFCGQFHFPRLSRELFWRERNILKINVRE